MSQAKKRDNKIDANEAKLIGDFFVTVGHELNDANAQLRSEVLERADSGQPIDYYWIDGAQAEYKMNLEVGTNTEGAGRKRESEVIMKADFKRAASPNQHAPFNVLFGVIAPAERDREAILSILRGYEPGTDFSPNCPIFHLGGSRYWVSAKGGTLYYVVELSPDKAIRIATLSELMENLKGMFTFLEAQLSVTHNGS